MSAGTRLADGSGRQIKKRNRKAIIITAAAMLTGVLLVLAGLFGGSVAALFRGSFDYTATQPEDIGKFIKTDIKVLYEDFGMTEWSCVYNLDDLTVSICLDADFENVYTFSLEDQG